jgi:putative oxidoreductase
VLRVTVIIFLLYLSGTMLMLGQLDIAFQKGNPLLLTTEGEFVIKNLVMIAAGLVLLGRARSAESDV